MKRGFRVLLKAATVIIVLLLVVGFLGRLHESLDAFSHVRHFLIIAALLSGVVSAAFGFIRLAVCNIMVIAAALVMSFPHLPFVTPSADISASLRVIQFNVKTYNAQQNMAVEWIIAQKPDVVTLQEYDPANHPGFMVLAEELPFEVRCKARGSGYVVVRSRHEILMRHCSEGEGFAWARISVRGQPITFASLHLAWPWPFKQAEHLQNLRSAFAAMPQPVVLAGDFNATPWSAAVGQVEKMTKTKAVGGFRISLWLDVFHTGKPWPALPIDHLLLPQGAQPKSINTGPLMGSDHVPVIAEFSLP